MARLGLPALALALGVATAVALVACGNRDEKGLLPGETADQIVANLDRVEQDASEGSCSSAAAEVEKVQDQIERLPSSVDSRLRARLEEGAQRLADVVNQPGACEASTETTTTTESSTTESTEKTTTKEKTESTTTPTTTTSTSTTTSTAPTTTTSTVPPGPATGGVPPGQRKKLSEGEGGGD